MKLILFLLAFLPGAALAQTLPALYDVIGVADTDRLNVRAEPSASSEIIGDYPFFQQGIEVTAFNDDTTWARVNYEERTGWISARFLRERSGQGGTATLPTPMSCLGTEPFWFMSIYDDQIEFEDPGADTGMMTFGRYPIIETAISPRGGFASDDMIGFVSREACTDGMTDRTYGFRVDFIRRGNGDDVSFSGCCTIEGFIGN
ncbi:SH3 domain-containing protein [uncultured Maritimibacter sp.]|jgi:uncharacterized membrane protein|uniref:SH3 domain-containing protein n=1 Tax=uncultured Maritimibacter sp. TaxID=991866 RepID=UPI002614564F|nr:SH3 domain-containing protein [uncultured Maritimibacter sp.]